MRAFTKKSRPEFGLDYLIRAMFTAERFGLCGLASLVLYESKVGGFVPQTQHVHLRKAAMYPPGCPESTPHPTPDTLHPTTDTLHPTPDTLHPTPHTTHPTSYIIHYTPCTIHRAPYTLHPTPCTLTPKHPPGLNNLREGELETGSIPRNQTGRGHEPIIVLEMAWVGKTANHL